MKKHTFILSDESVNAYGYKTRTSGIDLAQFKANPVMLFNHNSDNVIGNWENIRIEGNTLKADALFDEDDEQAMSIAKKVEKGIIKGCSIGFSIKRIERGLDRSPDVITECTLMEASITALPANKNAVRLYNDEGKLMNETEVLSYLSAHKPQPIMNKKIQFAATLLVALSLTENSSDEQIEQRLSELLNENKTLKEENKTLKTTAEEANKAKVKSLVDSAISSKRITEGQRAEYEELATSNYTSTKKVLDAITPVKKLNEQLKEGPEQTNTTGAKNREDWTYDDWAGKDPKGLEKLSHTDAAKFKQLQNDKVAQVRSEISIGVK